MSNEQFIGWIWQLLEGASITLQLTLICLPVGMVLGMSIALAKLSSSKIMAFFAELFTTIFRGLPELMTLLILYYGLQMLLEKGNEYGLGDIQISSFTAGVVALSLVAAAYSSENFLAALQSLERGQIEAARSFGMKRLQVFFRVIIPQVLRIALPGLSNNCTNILKDTSLVSIIALEDLMRKSYLASGNTKQPIIFYACTCLIYLAMSGVLLAIFSKAERHFSRGVIRHV